MKVLIDLKEIPTTCSGCPFYSNVPYTCHSERGTEAHCSLGYMHGDMRDVDFNSLSRRDKRYSDCQIENNIIKD